MAEFPISEELRELLGQVDGTEAEAGARWRPGKAPAPRDPRAGALGWFEERAAARLALVRREEAARLLYQRAHALRVARGVAHRIARGIANGAGHGGLHYGDFEALPPAADLEGRARALEAGPGEDFHLERLLQQPDPKQLLQVAMRLAPSDAIRIALSLDLALFGAHQQAEELLNDAHGRCRGTELGSYCLENLGFLKAVAGDLPGAAVAYEQAAETRTIPALAWLAFSVMAEDSAAAARAREWVDRRVAADHPALRWFQSFDGGQLERSAGAAALAGKLGEVAGPAARAVLTGTGSLPRGIGGVPPVGPGVTG